MANRGRPPHPDVLTPAEWNVLRHLREGLTNAEIGVRMGISPDGVKYHISNMLAKSGAADRHELAKWQPPSRKERGGFRSRSIAAVGVGLAAAISAVVVGVVALVGLTPNDEVAAEPLWDLRPTRSVETIVMERVLFLNGDWLNVPGVESGLENGVRHRERVVFRASGSMRIEDLDPADRSVHVQVGESLSQWTIGGELGSRVEIAGAPEPEPFPTGDTLAEIVANQVGDADPRLLGESLQAGRPVYVIAGKLIDCDADSEIEITLAIDKETLFVLRHEIRDKESGDLLQLTEVTSIEYDVPVNPSEFEPPPDVTMNELGPRSMPNAPSPATTIVDRGDLAGQCRDRSPTS